MDRVELTDVEKQKLQKLADLIEFGTKTLGNLGIDWPKVKMRKKTILKMAVAIHGHAESVHLLLSHGRTHSAEILSRPILETVINMGYIICGSNNETLNRFVTMDNTELARRMDEIITYKRDNPNVGSLTEADLVEGRDSRLSENAKYIKRFKYPVSTKFISLEARAMRVDKEYKKIRGKDPKHTKLWLYFTEYSLHSDSVHLGFRGLRPYADEYRNGAVLFPDGRPNEAGHIIDGVFVHYMDMLHFLSGQFHQPSSKEIRTFEKGYSL